MVIFNNLEGILGKEIKKYLIWHMVVVQSAYMSFFF